MSKRISWILIFTLLISSFGFATVSVAAEKEIEQTPYYVDVITTMGLMDMENTTDFMGGEYVDRETAIKYVLNLMNITSYPQSDKVYFQDVSKFSSSRDMINMAGELGLIKGDGNGNVRPDDNVTWTEAFALILRAMGYSFMTQDGSNSYNAIALEYGLLKGINVGGEFVTRDSFAKMLYNSFSMGIAEKVAFGEKEEYRINEAKSSLHFHNLKKAEGVVEASDIATIYYSAPYANKGCVVIDTVSYFVGDTNAGDFLGYNVEIFYSNDDDERVIAYVFKKNNEEVTYPLKKDTYKVNGDELVFWDENDVEQRIEVSPEMCMIYNGSSVDYDLTHITNPTFTGDFTLVKNSRSAEYDIIFINAFSNDIVSGIDSVKGYIYLTNTRYNGKTYIELPVYESSYRVKVIKNGEEVEYTSLNENDVISYAVNLNGRIVTIYASTKMVSGTIGAEAQRSEKFITIGENTYPLAEDYYADYGIELGVAVTAYLNYADKIVYVTSGITKNYGFVISTGYTKGADPQGAAKIFTADGNVENFLFAKKIKINQGAGYETHSAVKTALDNSTANKQLISYELDLEGKLSNVDFEQATSSNIIADQKRLVLSHTVTTRSRCSGYTLDGIGIRGTVLFQIPNTTEINENDCGITTFERSSDYNNIKFYDVGYDGIAKAALIMEASSGGGYRVSPSESYIVKEVIDAVDKDGMSGKMITYYKGDAESSIFVDDKATNTVITGTTSKAIDKLEFGDMITFELDKTGKLVTYSVVYDHKTQKDYTGVLAKAGDGVEYNVAMLVFKGVARYKSSSSITLEYISGSREKYEVFNGAATATVKVVDTARKTVTNGSLEKVSFTNFRTNTVGDKIIVTADRNNLKEVIIYE